MTLSKQLEDLINSFPVFLQSSFRNSLNALLEYFEISGASFNQNDYSSMLPGRNDFIEDLLNSSKAFC